MVAEPSTRALLPRREIVSMMDRMISGAEEPNAKSVRLATVAFQTGFCKRNVITSEAGIGVCKVMLCHRALQLCVCAAVGALRPARPCTLFRAGPSASMHANNTPRRG